MARLPVFTVVDATELRIHSNRFYEECLEEWRALLDWCKVHGLDPHLMPATGQVIVRNFKHRRVEYDEFVLVNGARVHDARELSGLQVRRTFRQGETPPMPFPDVILAHLNPRQTA